MLFAYSISLANLESIPTDHATALVVTIVITVFFAYLLRPKQELPVVNKKKLLEFWSTKAQHRFINNAWNLVKEGLSNVCILIFSSILSSEPNKVLQTI